MIRFRPLFAVAVSAMLFTSLHAASAAEAKIKALIIDGQNNHNWRATTPVMKKSLEDSGRFTVDVATAPERPKAPQKPKTDSPEELAKFKELQAKYKAAEEPYKAAMAKFVIPFEKYQVVLSNYNGDSWPKATETALDTLLKEGKIGLVIVHAADNSFSGWKEYNQMIGMGWRGKKFGERLKIDDSGKEVRVPKNTVDEKKIAPLSPMPANFADQIPEKDFYDLLAYLLAQRAGGK